MNEAIDAYLLAFDPYYREGEMRGRLLTDWRVENRTVDTAILSVKVPSTGKRIYLTMQARRLIELKVR
jgi:hypothetical protein